MSKINYRGPVVLAVLDGVGLAPAGAGNAVAQAHLEFLHRIARDYPCTALEASGEAVGLLPGQIGNSEVGHNTMGCGQALKQGVARIEEDFHSGEIWQSSAWQGAMRQVLGEDYIPADPDDNSDTPTDATANAPAPSASSADDSVNATGENPANASTAVTADGLSNVSVTAGDFANASADVPSSTFATATADKSVDIPAGSADGPIPNLTGTLRTLHFAGIFSDGGVHSDILHLEKMIAHAYAEGVRRVRVHCVFDGRDVAPQSEPKFIGRLEKFMAKFAGADFRIADGGGRMVITADRYENDWGMVKRGWDLMLRGENPRSFQNATEAVKNLRAADPDVQDQYLPEFVITDSAGEPVGPVRRGDALIYFDFRADRAIEIAEAFTYVDFPHFDRGEILPELTAETGASGNSPAKITENGMESAKKSASKTAGDVTKTADDLPTKNAENSAPDLISFNYTTLMRKCQDEGGIPPVFFAGMTEYNSDTHVPEHRLVPPIEIRQTLNQFLGARGKTQLAVSETVKFGHITYYFNGNSYEPATGEASLEVASDVLPFVSRPWMKSAEITDAVLDQLAEFDFVRVNFPGGDMVGHFGELEATITALEAIDLQLARLAEAVDELGGMLVITADHGNAEEIADAKTGAPVTAHSTNPVPCIFYDNTENRRRYRLAEPDARGLANLAATLATLLGLEDFPEAWAPALIEPAEE